MIRTLAGIIAAALVVVAGPEPTHFTITDAERGVYNMHRPLLADNWED